MVRVLEKNSSEKPVKNDSLHYTRNNLLKSAIGNPFLPLSPALSPNGERECLRSKVFGGRQSTKGYRGNRGIGEIGEAPMISLHWRKS
jgi:hypothetical protein